GSVVIGPDGGKITLPSGLTLDVPGGAFPDGSIVRFTQLRREDIPVEVTPDYPFITAFELNASADPQHYLNVSYPAPPGLDPSSTGMVAELVNVYNGAKLSLVDTVKVIDGRLKTSSPPCPGILNKFAKYAMFLDTDEKKARFGVALLSMVPPRIASIDVPALELGWYD